MEAMTRLVGNLQAAETELLQDILKERGRAFASDREAWAMLKESLERSKDMVSAAEKVFKEMWESVKDHNGDAFNALCMEMERSSAHIATEFVLAAATAKIATMSDEDAAMLKITWDEDADDGMEM